MFSVGSGVLWRRLSSANVRGSTLPSRCKCSSAFGNDWMNDREAMPSSLTAGSDVPHGELAAMTAVEEVDNQAKSKPAEETRPCDHKQTCHQSHAPHDRNDREQRHQGYLESSLPLRLRTTQEKDAKRHQHEGEQCADVRQIGGLADTEKPCGN